MNKTIFLFRNQINTTWSRGTKRWIYPSSKDWSDGWTGEKWRGAEGERKRVRLRPFSRGWGRAPAPETTPPYRTCPRPTAPKFPRNQRACPPLPAVTPPLAWPAPLDRSNQTPFTLFSLYVCSTSLLTAKAPQWNCKTFGSTVLQNTDSVQLLCFGVVFTFLFVAEKLKAQRLILSCLGLI